MFNAAVCLIKILNVSVCYINPVLLLMRVNISPARRRVTLLAWLDINCFYISQFLGSAFNTVIVRFYCPSSCPGYTSHYPGIEYSDLKTQSASIT